MSTLTYIEPPCNTEELFAINFTNLQNFLNSLVNNDKELYSNLSIHENRLNELDLLRAEIKEQNERLHQCEKKLKSTDLILERNNQGDQETIDKLNYHIEVNKKK